MPLRSVTEWNDERAIKELSSVLISPKIKGYLTFRHNCHRRNKRKTESITACHHQKWEIRSFETISIRKIFTFCFSRLLNTFKTILKVSSKFSLTLFYEGNMIEMLWGSRLTLIWFFDLSKELREYRTIYISCYGASCWRFQIIKRFAKKHFSRTFFYCFNKSIHVRFLHWWNQDSKISQWDRVSVLVYLIKRFEATYQIVLNSLCVYKVNES